MGIVDPVSLFSLRKEYWLEIGFGGGEHLASQAAQNPNVGIIGCEPYINGIASLLARIDQEKLSNICLFTGDARLLMKALPDATLSRAFVLFPDPWPKARHHKRRLICPSFLNELARLLKPGGRFRLASDDPGYIGWMTEQMMASRHFTWQVRGPEDWRQPPADWVNTRYEQKAIAAGRRPVYFEFVRNS